MNEPSAEDEAAVHAIDEADRRLREALAELESAEAWDTYTVRYLEVALDGVVAAFVYVIRFDDRWERDEMLETNFFGWLDKFRKGAELSSDVDELLELASKGRYGDELDDEDVKRAEELRGELWKALEEVRSSRPWTKAT